MTQSGDFRPGRDGVRSTTRPAGPDAPGGEPEVRSTAMGRALALAAVLLAALAWAVLRGILDLSVGLLVVAGSGGWAIGAALRGTTRSRLLAGSLGLAAWLASLVSTWLITRLVLPGSSVGFLERLEQTSLLDYTLQQAGLLELASLILFVGAALVSSRRGHGRRAV